MTKRRRLVKETREAIKFRGHKMKPFHHDCYGAYYTCPECGMGATVTLKPGPNGIDVAGEAVSLSCRNGAS